MLLSEYIILHRVYSAFDTLLPFCIMNSCITVLCPSYLILCTMTALSKLACCRVCVGSLSSLLGNVVINTQLAEDMDGRELRGQGEKCRWSRKLHSTPLQRNCSTADTLEAGVLINRGILSMYGKVDHMHDLLQLILINRGILPMYRNVDHKTCSS